MYGKNRVKEKISIPFQSKITCNIVDQILDTKQSYLTPYVECMHYHIAMLKVYNNHFSKIKGINVETCPIT